MKKRTIAEEAARLLAGLGDTPDEIAATLRGAGYRGVRGNPWRCPCGSCLADHLGVAIRVERGLVRDQEENGPFFVEPKDGGFSEAGTPSQVTDFVANFDSGLYRDLETISTEP